MEFTNVQLRVENRVGYISINHPPANALNAATFSGLNECLDYVEAEKEIKVLVVTGEGKYFVAGADIKEFSPAFGNAAAAQELAKVGQRVFNRMEQFPKPIIASINGACLGGGFELALGCHIRIAAEQATLGLPELKLGLIPGFGGTQRLARLTNKAKALELILTSKFIDGKEAQRLGIVNIAVPLEELNEAVGSLAQSLASEKSAVALASALRAVNAGVESSLEEGLALEAELFGQIFLSEDAKEGVQAFLEKRKAQFKDQ